ncbi:MAG: transporter substrate-binding domain-containing protein [Clostridia bacterium]|nr:transporter substrate-binding domain-containing protein [Clostridia bacterium]
MKKFLSIILAVIMTASLLVLSACGGEEAAEKPAVGVQNGTTGYFYMAGDASWGFDGFDNVKVNGYENGGLAMADLKAGNIDYVVIDGDVARELVAGNEGTKMIEIPLTTESYGVAVDKAQPELLADINKVLAEKAADIKAIFDKYADVNDDNAAAWEGATIPKVEIDDSKDQLVLATNAAFAPFEFKVGADFAGIDMEIGKLIADALGKELVIVDMEFDSITTALGKNGIDIGLAAMTINPAREKVVSFSTAYYTDAYQVVVCKADDTTFDACKTTEELVAKMKELGK